MTPNLTDEALLALFEDDVMPLLLEEAYAEYLHHHAQPGSQTASVHDTAEAFVARKAVRWALAQRARPVSESS